MLDFQAYLNGLSIKTIADTLTAQGVPTRSGQEQWKANTITYILTNEKYIGDTLFQKYYGEMTVPFKNIVIMEKWISTTQKIHMNRLLRKPFSMQFNLY